MKFFSIRAVALAVLGATVLACGGAGGDGNAFPLSWQPVFLAINNDNVQNIHIVMGAEAFAPANQVTPSSQRSLTPSNSVTWVTSLDVETLTFRAGRNGAELTTTQLQISGEAAEMYKKNGSPIRVTWDGTSLAATH